MSTAELVLEAGSHPPNDGVCLLEAAAREAGEAHSDRPACVSPVIAAYGRVLNDWLNYDERQRLVPFVPQLIGTVAPIEVEKKRTFLAVDVSFRQIMPMWLEALD